MAAPCALCHLYSHMSPVVPLLGNDYESHLLGIQVFMNTYGPTVVASDLRKASFWVGLRQEVTMALSSQRPIKISLRHSFIDQSLTDASDDMWANRIIVHCADVVQFCFGDDNQKTDDYRRLLKYDDDWLHSRPPSFLPVAFSAADSGIGEAFPRIMYLSHSVGGFNLIMRSLLLFSWQGETNSKIRTSLKSFPSCTVFLPGRYYYVMTQHCPRLGSLVRTRSRIGTMRFGS